MGAMAWMLVYSKGNPQEILKSNSVLDRAATSEFAATLFSSEKITPSGEGDLSFTCPADDELLVGCFSGLVIVAAKEFGIDIPSKLPAKFIDACPGHSVYLYATHSSVDWFAYAIWKDGKLQRSLSLSSDSGILEDMGDRLSFEEPFWNGEHPAFNSEEYKGEHPFPFHPLELGQAALLSLFGYQLEGFIAPSLLEPEKIPLMRFARKKSLWRFLKSQTNLKQPCQYPRIQLPPHQQNMYVLRELASAGIDLLATGQFELLVERYGYAVALDRNPVDAVRMDLAHALSERAGDKLLQVKPNDLSVIYYKDNASHLRAAIDCEVPTQAGKCILVSFVVIGTRTRQSLTLEHICAEVGDD